MPKRDKSVIVRSVDLTAWTRLMMALDRLPSGNVRARLMVDGQRVTAAFSTEREASDWQIVTRAAAVERRASETLTVERCARRWLGEFIDAARDLDRYRRDVEHVIPCLGTYRLSAVSPADIAVLLSRSPLGD